MANNSFELHSKHVQQNLIKLLLWLSNFFNRKIVGAIRNSDFLFWTQKLHKSVKFWDQEKKCGEIFTAIIFHKSSQSEILRGRFYIFSTGDKKQQFLTDTWF